MRKTTKRILSCILLATACLALNLSVAALNPGDLIDHVLATDIRAFIDGYEIPSYNINGKLGIVAEDLRGYGFDVVWNGDDRTLSISRNAYKVTSPAEISEKNTAPIGTKIEPVLFTDIVTYLEGAQVESFNIGGRTIIYFSNISKYGTYLYDDNARASMISYDNHDFKTITLPELPQKIIHGGGEVGFYLGSNSLEALNNTHSKGFRVIELDFMLSSDGKPVCIHNWSQYYSNQLGSVPVTAAEFANVKIFNRFTALTLDSLVKWMVLHPDVYIVTDVKEDNVNMLRHIALAHPEIIGRIIPQIYQYDEYVPVRAMGYSNILLTLYRLPTYFDKVNSKYNAEFAKKHRLLGVTADATLANQKFVDTYVAAGVPLFVHTINDAEEQQKFCDIGVTGIYTAYAK